MKFGKDMEVSVREEWREKYIDYMSLKTKLYEVRDEADNPHENPAVLEAKRAIFQGYLDSEIEKVVTWYKSYLHGMHSNIKNLERDLALAPQILADAAIETDFKLKGITTLRNRWRTVGTELASLLQYVSLNMIAMRKILKKYAKHVEPTRPMEGYCTLEIQHPDDPSWAFVQGTFLPDYIAQDLDLMQNDPAVTDIQERTEVALGYLQMIRKQVMASASGEGTDSTKISVAVPPLFASGRRGARVAHMTRIATLGHTSEDEQNILRQIDAAATHARVTSRLVRSRPWTVATAGIFEEPPGDLSAHGNKTGLWISLAMSFLHGCVYFMPTPSLHHTCIELGVDLSKGALIFAVADVGEILSSFGYTFWTNRSYKSPLLFSACCGVLGCMLSSLAFSIPVGGWIMINLGRFLVGMASARTICRRYIADCISLADRTQASLGMVVASSTGMAVGSLISVPLMDFGRHIFGDSENFEPISVLGWVGAGCWCSALVVAILFFRDPFLERSTEEVTGDTSADHWSVGSSGSDPPSRKDSIRLNCIATRFQKAVLRMLGSKHVDWAEFHQALVPTVCCFVCLSIFKLALAVFSSSLPLFSHGTLWYWQDKHRAIVLGGLAFTMLPSGYLASRMSIKVSDRRILTTALGFSVLSCVLLYQLGSSKLDKFIYILGGVLMHMSVVGIEGSSMSLLSKVIHHSMARGPVNCGLLTTVAGTVGRLIGNVMVIGLASLVTVDQDSAEFELILFSHVLYGTLSMLICACLLYTLTVYGRLR